MATGLQRTVLIGAIIVFALAVLVRVAFFALFLERIEQLSELGFSTDTFKFERLVDGLEQDGVYGIAGEGPTIDQPPLYVFALFGLRSLFGNSAWAIWIFNGLIGSLTAVFCYLTARLFFKQPAAFTAGIIAAVFPDFILYGAVPLAETLFVFMLAAGVYFAAKTWLDKKWGYAVAAGIAFGLAALTREVALLLPMVIALVFLKRIGWKKSLLLAGCAFLAIAPWTIRNAVTFKALVPITARSGYALFQGSVDPGSGYNTSDYRNPRERLSRRYWEQYREVMIAAKGIKNPIERDRIFRDHAVKYIVNNPGKYLGYFPKKLVFFWQPQMGPEHVQRIGYGWAIFAVMIGYYLLLFAGFTGGLRMRGFPALLFWTVVGYFVLTHLFFSECEPRYHLPALVVFPYAVAFGAFKILGDIRGKDYRV